MKGRLVVFVFLLALLGCNKPEKISYYEIDIDTGWVCQFDKDTAWLPATVPDNGINDLRIRGFVDTVLNDAFLKSANYWLTKKRTYKVSFDIPQEILIQDSVYLKFEGIADCADIYLNGQFYGRSDNMFKSLDISCKGKLKEYQNVLEVRMNALPVSDKSKNRITLQKRAQSSHECRKAAFLEGSEINPPLPFFGIWKPVKIIAWSKSIIQNVRFETIDLTEKKAVLEAALIVESSESSSCQLSIKLNKAEVASFPVNLKKGKQILKYQFEVNNPDLWWCNGLGAQNMQTAQVALMDNNQMITEKTIRFGIRKIELVQQTDSIGYNFFIKLNNKPVFIKGAAFMPVYTMQTSEIEKVYTNVISNARSANLNLLRVWGGGIYESDRFYELSDENGIMVWQDLPFSCNEVTQKVLKEFKLTDEIIENITRIGNHPSLAILYCNPDISTANGYEEESVFGDNENITSNCQQFFLDELPSKITVISNVPFYSKFIAGTKLKASKSIIRDWRVWHGSAPLSAFSEIQGGFFIEYGMKSIPFFNSGILNQEELPGGLFEIGSESAQNYFMPEIENGLHNNNLIFDYLQMYYNDPCDFGSTLYLTQVLQAQALKSAIESHRIHKPFCMGSVFWHFNDNYPGITWSITDYNQNLKPSWFTVKNAFKNIVVIPERINGDIRIWAANDSLNVFEGNCLVSLLDFDGNLLFTKKINVYLPAQQTEILWLANEGNIVSPNLVNKVLLHIQLMDKKNQQVDENFVYFTDPKYLDLPVPDISYTIQPAADGFQILFSTNSFAKNVVWRIDDENIRFSDNNIDMLPGRVYGVKAWYTGPMRNLEENLKIISLIDSY